MDDLKYNEILRLNKHLANEVKGKKLRVKVLSNVIVSQLKEIGEYFLRSHGVNAEVILGNYDNIVQDAQNAKDIDIVIIFWEAANIAEGFHYRSNTMPEDELEGIINKTKSEIELLIKSLKKKSMVIMNKFSSTLFDSDYPDTNNFDRTCSHLNDFIESHVSKSMRIVNTDRIISNLSVSKSVDMRVYYSSKSLYSVEFLTEYVNHVFPHILSIQGKLRKALIFDCDNTLWKGVLGEDGYDNIQMSNDTANGSIFKEIQHIAVDLSRMGVIIGLCSKNNQHDVEDVIKRHPEMTLKEENIIIKKINWDDKASNLRAIAEELNIGLDSLVFVDDSEFEVNLVNELVPEVITIQVPKKLSDYPRTIRKATRLFFNESQTKEDRDKTQIYKNEALRKKDRQEFKGVEDYLRALELQLTIYTDDKSFVPRAAQLTQKTNQFNLTTIRYTNSDITRFIDSDDHVVFTFELSDKFDSSGTTGLAIVRLNSTHNKALLDTFLMSCRVIGRNVEYNFFQFIIECLKGRGIEKLEARYVQTLKNEQVKDFYNKCGCMLIRQNEKERFYNISLNQSHNIALDYIGVHNGRQD